MTIILLLLNYRHPDLCPWAGVALAGMGLVGGQHPQLPDGAVEPVPLAARHVVRPLQHEVPVAEAHRREPLRRVAGLGCPCRRLNDA